ncbi:DUF1441 family protein [Salmonella enterica]|jgi:hypothetical protein|uniref:DUF1441 family protein n=1 Tax=Gammaproteobacteria TaxID=1236 RepID=UPI0007186B8D|nr:MULTISPECIES: DUF1441 family protein [Gammaproteobacteria]HEB4994529.1 DUF1441 family protein [Aeromonas hydrophila subsp. hydrophila]HEH9401872.1 DUF1441 family protein [Aeromonas sobria]EFY7055498.1 DUF1441 family protein [Salmonella enterica]EGE9999221.1 DUF1441 family protein [Salmonella enterica]EGN9571872.1 DUF1441 family protein [Salmonella enterica]
MADVTHIGDAYAWNITRIAEAFGMSRDTVRKRLREAGVQPKGTRGNAPVYLLADVGPALFQGGGEQTAASHQPDKMPPKDRKEWYQSENERLKFQREIGDLIPVGEYRDDLSRVLKKVVSFFESLPDRMERRRTFSAPQLEELERAADEFRNQLYSELLEVDDNG